MALDLRRLIELTKSSPLLTEEDRKYWLEKMETNMTEEQLQQLAGILEKGEEINWEEELPKYKEVLQEAEQVVAQADESFRNLS